MKFKYNDGGRASAGYKGTTGDCVCRAICILTKKPYKEVYTDLATRNQKEKPEPGARPNPKSAAAGISTDRYWFKNYMSKLGFVKIPHTGMQLNEDLPMGRLFVVLDMHVTAVIDKVLYDINDCTKDGHRKVYALYQLKK